MFTGIIEELGAVQRADRGTLVIACRTVHEGTSAGDSIAVNGVDLTVAQMDGASLTFNCMPETYRRSNLGELKPGDLVNLERSVTPATRLSGHIVRGVVEATGSLVALTPEEDAVLARFSAPADILRHTVVKGPVTVDGVSLTVVARDRETFTVSLVQYTQEHTNLTRKRPGDSVNLESDIIARYVDQLLSERESRPDAPSNPQRPAG
ncbi:MAG: riboflavin synthase [Dehalococcoidia bacterium]|nr:riboflavin synthase [Dehalococcoidia bacterium]